MQVFSDVYSILFLGGGFGWGNGSEVALCASVSLCGGLWRGGLKYCCGRLSGGLCGGLRAFLFFSAGGIF